MNRGTVAQTIAGLSMFSDLVDIMKNPSDFKKSLEDFKKELEITDDLQAKLDDAKAIVAKAESANEQINQSHNDLMQKVSANDLRESKLLEREKLMEQEMNNFRADSQKQREIFSANDQLKIDLNAREAALSKKETELANQQAQIDTITADLNTRAVRIKAREKSIEIREGVL